MIDPIIRKEITALKSKIAKRGFEGKKVLITGGAGFIGSWLCDVLIETGSEVTVVDDFSTGQMENINHLLTNPTFKLIKHDACTYNSKEKFDLLLHFAGHASPEEYQTHPIETLRASSFASANMAELARRNDAALLFASTSEVYGDAEIVPTPESYWGKVNPIGLRSCYDEGKRFAEALFLAYHKQYGLDVKIPRIFNSYGPRLREDGLYARALSRFVKQALANDPITIYGDGKQTRAFCYITDTILGILLLALCDKAKGEVVNVGSPKETTILELAERIIKLTKSQSALAFCPLPKDDPKRRCPDASKLEKMLGWKPTVTLDEGLKKTIEWFIAKQAAT